MSFDTIPSCYKIIKSFSKRNTHYSSDCDQSLIIIICKDKRKYSYFINIKTQNYFFPLCWSWFNGNKFELESIVTTTNLSNISSRLKWRLEKFEVNFTYYVKHGRRRLSPILLVDVFHLFLYKFFTGREKVWTFSSILLLEHYHNFT